MPYQEHTLLTFHGVLGASAAAEQTWSIGIRFPADAAFWVGYIGGGGDPATDAIPALVSPFTANFTADQFSDSVWLTYAKMAVIGADGSYVSGPWVNPIQPGSAYGSSEIHLPFQDSIAVTFHHLGLGHGNYGRVYLPPMGLTPAPDGLISTSEQTALAEKANDWIVSTNTVLGDTLDAPGPVSIMSRTAATAKAVNETAVGRVIDTQRRRRDKLVEGLVYTVVT